MKKFILALALISGINVSIKSSYSTYLLKGAKGASLLLATAAGTMAGNLLNDNKIDQLSLQVDELIKNNDALTNQLSSLDKKENSFLNKFGTIGLVLSALLTGYRYVQHGLGEIQGFYQVLNAASYATHSFKNKVQNNEVQDNQACEIQHEQTIRNSDQRFKNMTPEQRLEFLRKHGHKN